MTTDVETTEELTLEQKKARLAELEKKTQVPSIDDGSSMADKKARLAELESKYGQEAPVSTPASLAEKKARLQDLEKKYNEDVSLAETAARGVLKGSTLGFDDELQAMIADLYVNLSGNRDLFPKENDAVYKAARDSLRKDYAESAEANPKTALASEIAGGMLTLRGAPATSGLKEAMAQGATIGSAYGLGSSEADITTPEGAWDAAVDTLTGSLMGGGAGALGQSLLPMLSGFRSVADKTALVRATEWINSGKAKENLGGFLKMLKSESANAKMAPGAQAAAKETAARAAKAEQQAASTRTFTQQAAIDLQRQGGLLPSGIRPDALSQKADKLSRIADISATRAAQTDPGYVAKRYVEGNKSKVFNFIKRNALDAGVGMIEPTALLVQLPAAAILAAANKARGMVTSRVIRAEFKLRGKSDIERMSKSIQGLIENAQGSLKRFAPAFADASKKFGIASAGALHAHLMKTSPEYQVLVSEELAFVGDDKEIETLLEPFTKEVKGAKDE